MSDNQHLISSEAAFAERMRLAGLMTDVAVALTRNDSLPQILANCARSLVEHLDAAFARIWALNGDTNILELQASEGMYTHLNGAHSRVPVGKLEIGLIAKERKPHLTNAVLGDPRIADQEWARRENMVSFAGYPLIVGNHLVGVIAMFARVPVSRAALQAIEVIAHGIALGIERERSEDAARASTEQVARIVESITDGFATVDRDLRYAFVNGEGARILGRTIEELLGRTIYEAFPDINGTPFDRAMRTAIQEQKPQEVEEYFPAMNKWFSLRLFPTPDGLSLYYRDVTERKISEQRLLLQYAVSRVLNAGKDIETTGTELLSAIGLSLSWRVGLMWTPIATASASDARTPIARRTCSSQNSSTPVAGRSLRKVKACQDWCGRSPAHTGRWTSPPTRDSLAPGLPPPKACTPRLRFRFWPEARSSASSSS